MKMVEGQPQAFPLPACTDVVVQVCNQFKRIHLAFEIDVKEDNVLLARVEGDKISLGTYAIEVKGKIFGNDWRSNEYPQFAIVSNNADADTEFGTTDEGDNSVEMDTAMVILPPTVGLSDLINKANETLKTNKETNDTLNTNEEARKEAETLRKTAEQGRVSAEEARVSAEGDRTRAEEARMSAEAERVKAEQARTEIEITRQTNELTRKDNETKRAAAENVREKAEEARVDAESIRANAESERVDAEAQRASAESDRANAESSRVSAENSRVEAEKKRQSDTDTAIKRLDDHRTEFDSAEAARESAESGRVEAEKVRQQAETNRASAEGARANAETARVVAETKRESDFDAAIKAANTATLGAEKVDATITEENVFEVTDRTGVKKTLDLSGMVSAQSDVARIQESMGAYSDRPDITLVAKETNKAISADGVKVTKAGWAIAEFMAELGNIYLFNPGETSSDVCVFAEYIDKVETRAIDYAYTYDKSGRVLTAKATYNGKTYTYTYDYSNDETVITDQDNNKVSYLPSVYTTTVGAYNPMTILNTDAELPQDGYCRFVSNFTTASAIKIVVSYKVNSANLTMKVVRDGSTANMCSQLAKINKKVDDIAEKWVLKSKMLIHTCKNGSVVNIDNKSISLEARKSYIFENFRTFRFIKGQEAINKLCISNNISHRYQLFANFKSLTSLTFINYKPKISSLHEVFIFCKLLKNIDVSGWDTSNTKDFTSIFYDCSSLVNIDVSGWDTSNATNMYAMFYNCSSLANIDVSGWDTSNVTNMHAMFYNCSSLANIDVSGWDTSNVTNMYSMFGGCSSLANITFGENFGKMQDAVGTLNLSNLLAWKNDSVKSLLTLYDRKANGMGVITLKLHANTKAVLGEDGIAQLTAKGYIIA